MKALLEVRGLTKHYAGFALENLCFSLVPGRILGLIGVNGAGKSTAFRCMLNLSRPDAGSVSMFGRDFYREEMQCKQEIGVVFGDVDMYPLKRLETITAAVRRFYRNWDSAQYEGWMHRFGLEKKKTFRSLSSGMKTKYLLTLALSHRPRLLLLDEPTSGLDPVSRDELLHIFRDIVREGECSILFSTHITSDLEHCADDIAYLQNGQLIACADKAAFLHLFEALRTPEDAAPLSLEEIMLRTERKNNWDATLV